MLTFAQALDLLNSVDSYSLHITKFEEHHVIVESLIPGQGWAFFNEWSSPEAFANWARNYDGAE